MYVVSFIQTNASQSVPLFKYFICDFIIALRYNLICDDCGCDYKDIVWFIICRTMKVVTNASDWSITSSMMDHRQHHPLGNTELTNQINRHMFYPDIGDSVIDFKNYLYLSQVTRNNKYA